MSTAIEEFARLRSEALKLRDSATRLTTEHEQAQEAVDEAERTLTELGFDVAGDLDAQLQGLRNELEAKLDELRKALRA